jgi:hypothetical protein
MEKGTCSTSPSLGAEYSRKCRHCREHFGLHLFLFNDEAAIWVPRAIVRWQSEMRFGLEFLSWEDADRQRLSRFIATRITAAA